MERNNVHKSFHNTKKFHHGSLTAGVSLWRRLAGYRMQTLKLSAKTSPGYLQDLSRGRRHTSKEGTTFQARNDLRWIEKHPCIRTGGR